MALRLGGTIDAVDRTLTERYVAPPAWRRPVTIATVAALAVVALAWLVWAAWVQSTPKVQSQLMSFQVVGEHSVTARIEVHVSSDAANVSCTVEALAQDHSLVGELHFRPTSGTNEVTVRTERIATSVDVPGCTAQGQDHPR